MAARLRRAISSVLVTLIFTTGILALSIDSAGATVATSDASCLVINSSNELVSADFCLGDIVIPASVTTIKSNAFVVFKGAVSFEANSQLQTVERLAFHGGGTIASIVFPPSLTSVADFAIIDTGSTVFYIEGNAAAFGQNAIWQRNVGTPFVQARDAARLTQGIANLNYQAPFQIDCNSLSGDKDFFGGTFVALELHNCRHPRSPTDANPPSVAGYVLNAEINESVSLRSLDGSHSGVLRLRQLGGSSMQFSAAADVSSGGFSISALGDEFEMPRQTGLTCELGSGARLPLGVALTTDCRLVAANGAAVSSDTTDTVIAWVAHPGASNSVNVAANGAVPTSDFDTVGNVSVRLSVRKTAELSPTQYFQMLLLSAQYSGTSRDWNLAINAYGLIPSGAPAPDLGQLADSFVRAFELGQTSKSLATQSVNSFAAGQTAYSSFLTELRSRIEIQAAKTAVATFEASGVRANAVRQQIMALPTSAVKTDLLARFNASTDLRFRRTSTLVGNIRTYVFSNPYSAEQLVVPSGVSQISVSIVGAEGSQGGDDRDGRPDRAGFKGVVTGQFAVIPGQLITVAVGESGNDAPSACLPGGPRIADDPLVAKGGTNPLGGYGGGSGGSAGVDSCVYSSDSGGGYGGAGGAASVVQVGDSTNHSSIATLVAGGSAGSGGSTAAGPKQAGAIGLSTFTARADQPSTDGQSGQAFNYFAIVDDLVGFYEPFITGSAGGGGGGAAGGARGDWTYSTFGGCPTISFCFGGSSPGRNSTSGLIGLAESYLPYTFDAGMQSNGSVTISFVEPVVVTPTPTPTPQPTPSATLSPSPSTTPSPTGTTSHADTTPALVKAPDAPRDVSAVALWKSAEVSWKAPIDDGNSPITEYEVLTSTGTKCSSQGLSCHLTGLTPGQRLDLSVRAKNSVAFGPAGHLLGERVFIPLSLNLWQLKASGRGLSSKRMNTVQLRELATMLSQDAGGFRLMIRLASNSSGLSESKLRKLLATETLALKAQLRTAGVLGKVNIQTAVMAPNSKAKRPSVILVVRKP
jgi:hypothetical protein